MEQFTTEQEQKEFLNDVREIAKKAFWDSIYEKIEQQDFSSIISILHDIKNRLLGLIPNNNKIINEINNELDIDLIKQQLENNAFDCNDFLTMFDCFCKWILFLGSPAWDNTTKSFRNSIHNGVKEEGYVKMLKYALDGLNDAITITEYEVEDFRKRLKEQEEQEKKEKQDKNIII